jgi:hypothetical protein
MNGMTSFATRPTCSHCGRRINLFECLWRELPGGELRPSFALDLQGIQRRSRRLVHVGCLVEERAARPAQLRLVA